jgi:nucleotide-binding universal stress UspA family protein
MFRTILVPLDGSPLGEQALQPAARLARAGGGRLILAHVHVLHSRYPITIEGMPIIDEHLRSLAPDHERAYLQRLAELPLLAGITVETAWLEGTVVTALADYTQQMNVDLIILSTHGHSGFAQFWLGSTAEALLRTTHVPLLLVRPQTVGELNEIRRIMVPLDGSLIAERALAQAESLAAVDNGELLLVRIVHEALEGEAETLSDKTVQERRLEAEQRAGRYLRLIEEQLAARGLRATSIILAADQPARALLQVAADHHVDVVAMATHGHTGITKLFLGSTADKLIRAAAAPVLAVLPPPGADTVDARLTDGA